MLTIRLQRVGRKNQPVFRIVLAEKHRAAAKKTVEALGVYNPRSKEFTVREERVKYWLEKHIPLSPTVHNLFVTKKLVDAKKVQAWKPKKKIEAVKTADVPAQAGNQTPSLTPSPQGGGKEEERSSPQPSPEATAGTAAAN